MVIVYALKNEINSEIYVGISKDPQARLVQHNSGTNRYTKAFIPWKIFFTEERPDYASARIREKYFKAASGKKHLRKLI